MVWMAHKVEGRQSWGRVRGDQLGGSERLSRVDREPWELAGLLYPFGPSCGLTEL
jgi:hypothetical protein